MIRARNANLLVALIFALSACGSDDGGADTTQCTPSTILCSESKPCAADQVCSLADDSSWGECYPGTCTYQACELHADCVTGDDCVERQCVGPSDERECDPEVAPVLSV